MLKNIRKSSKPIKIQCNAGMSKTELKGELGGMTVHHNPNGIANVLSLKSVVEKHRVTYNSWDWNGVFKVHTKDGVVEFKPSERGLPFVDVSVEGDVVQHMLVTADMPKGKDNKEIESANKECMMITTVGRNFEGYTRHEIEKAQEARRLKGMIENPTERELEGMVREKLISDCPVALCKMFIILTGFLVLTLLTLGKRRPGRNRRTLGWITSKSPGTSSICTNM
jgi:hypothetical protein